jgi:hypothetical protein
MSGAVPVIGAPPTVSASTAQHEQKQRIARSHVTARIAPDSAAHQRIQSPVHTHTVSRAPTDFGYSPTENDRYPAPKRPTEQDLWQREKTDESGGAECNRIEIERQRNSGRVSMECVQCRAIACGRIRCNPMQWRVTGRTIRTGQWQAICRTAKNGPVSINTPQTAPEMQRIHRNDQNARFDNNPAHVRPPYTPYRPISHTPKADIAQGERRRQWVRSARDQMREGAMQGVT